jgi:formylglycine-generating enzyme required for sulfatase activity
MDLRKAYETLGLVRGASTDEVETAYAQNRDAVEARLARVSSEAVAARYREVRTRLDGARETLLSAPQPPADEPLAHAFGVLGLSPNASPLDVASAYVALCEEIDREVEDAPGEELRRACLEARADVDAAYQRCALSPLRDAPEAAAAADGGPPARYETQMAAEPFEAPEAPEAQEPVLRIEAEDPIVQRSGRKRRRRRGLRRVAVAAALVVLTAGVGSAAAWWAGLDFRTALDLYVPSAVVNHLAPPGPPAELVEARTTAESLRRRVSEERGELQSRVEDAETRADELEVSWSSAEDPADRERMASELERVRSRRELAAEHAELAEQHVLASDELAVAYGKMERADELVSAGEAEEAVQLFSEVRDQLEQALAKLDVVEEAVGARSEAEAGLEAWRALAASADLADLPPAVQGVAILEEARELLAGGDFDAAIPELRRAAQQFAAALAEGRKLAAASRALDAQSEAELAELAPPANAASALEAEEAALETGSEEADEPAVRDAPAVAAPPPTALAAPRPSLERAAIKLVLVPAGDFLYGCQTGAECQAGEVPAQRVALGAFRIDRTEVRVNEYRACVEAGSCTAPDIAEDCNWEMSDRGDHPVNCVDWRQAVGYCGWVGKRLPTEQEWEKAARGTDGRIYPWGNHDASCYLAVIAGGGAPGCGRGSTSPVASRAEGRSPFGLFDMAGNVLEWTADEAGGGMRVARGGSWRQDASPARASSRAKLPSQTRDARIGFRCAQGGGGLYATSVP